MTEKKRYWLKLDKNFLKSSQMKVVKSMPNGKDYIIFYLSLMLESVETVGHLRFTALVPYNAEMLAAITDTNVDIVKNAIKIFCELGLMRIFDDGTIFLPQVPEITGKESESAERVRQYRERLKEKEELLALQEPKKQPKTNAQRQKQFRAKRNCEGKQHIPHIEDDYNNKRYNGNYYVVIQRDKYKCAICESIENLCVHHIDGFDENKHENSCTNKMITLCRCCHSKVHAGLPIEEDILNSIDYYEESNEMLQSNDDVTNSNDNKEKEKKKEEERIKTIKEIVEYLNLKLNSKYRHSTKSTKESINARLEEGFTVDDFKTVIDKQYTKWINTEWEQYLRPSTLFAAKNFENYLNAPIKVQGGENNAKPKNNYGGLDLSRFE